VSLTDTRRELMSPDRETRRRALETMRQACIDDRVTCKAPGDRVNMHCHTFYSYNGYGHSPTSLVWLAREEGWRALATVDFDVLDAVDETLEAGDRVGVRTASGLESRVFLPEFSTREINSPGEPGVLYHIGMGFVPQPAPAAAAEVLADMRRRAAERNRDMVARVNAYLDPVTVDYDRDVLPLTPRSNATERHILIAYDRAARERYPRRADLVAFWARVLAMDPATVDGFLGDEPFPHDAIRSRLMKAGGPGYVQPGPDTFPPIDEVNAMIVACGAVPVWAWLDGLSEGEQAAEELADLQIARGAGAICIIPDRNWNIADPAERERKVRELYRVVDLARDRHLPVIVGTEMNKAGQPIVDDFDAEPLRPLRDEFVRGADFIYGHTVMQRALGRGYQSEWARQHLPERRERNALYIAVGQAVEPGAEGLARVAALENVSDPDDLLARLKD
jgi:hypothetical protein